MTRTISSTVSVLLLLVLGATTTLTSAEVVQDDVSIGRVGNLRYSYDDDLVDSACDNVVLIGVGTAMNIDAYDLVSTEMVQGKSVVAMITDHVPNWFVKLDEKRYANFANSIVKDIQNIVPACKNTTAPNKILIGGHSASGQAAWESIQYLDFKPDGFIGLDPFRMDPDDNVDLPTLNFGFTKTTCGVTTSQAAEAAYQASNDTSRVFYQVDNSDQGSLGHCSFTDRGCFGIICPAAAGSESVRKAVGESLVSFLQSLYSNAYDRDSYTLDDVDVKLNLFLNQDKVPEMFKIVGRYLRGAMVAN